MAYFGGSVSARPWSRIDMRFVIIFLCSFFGLVVCLFFARDLLLFREAGAASTLTNSDPATSRISGPVIVAVREIPAGAWLTPSMFRFESIPINGIENQVVRSFDEITGSFARAALAPNTPLMKGIIVKGGSAPEITDRIPAGFRAVAIPVNALTGVEGWVQPGVSVDVVWSIEQDKQLSVSTIVENARVLSVERSMEPKGKIDAIPSSDTRHITLLVTTQDAQKIQLAKSAGSLNLSLRGSDDSNTTGDSTLTTEEVLARPNPVPSIRGRVRVDGREYVLRGVQMIPADEDIPS